MTLDELIEEIKDLQWRLDYRAIRCINGRCPIIAAYQKKFPKSANQYYNNHWQEAANRLGIDPILAGKIVAASDYNRESLVTEELEVRDKLESLIKEQE